MCVGTGASGDGGNLELCGDSATDGVGGKLSYLVVIPFTQMVVTGAEYCSRADFHPSESPDGGR